MVKKSVPTTPAELKKHILAADTSKVSAEVLTNIKNALASDAVIQEEVCCCCCFSSLLFPFFCFAHHLLLLLQIDSLLSYDGRSGELTAAEAWLQELYTVPRLKAKLNAMLWKITWRSRLAEAEPLRKEVFRAIMELKNELFTKFCVRHYYVV